MNVTNEVDGLDVQHVAEYLYIAMLRREDCPDVDGDFFLFYLLGQSDLSMEDSTRSFMCPPGLGK